MKRYGEARYVYSMASRHGLLWRALVWLFGYGVLAWLDAREAIRSDERSTRRASGYSGRRHIPTAGDKWHRAREVAASPEVREMVRAELAKCDPPLVSDERASDIFHDGDTMIVTIASPYPKPLHPRPHAGDITSGTLPSLLAADDMMIRLAMSQRNYAKYRANPS